MGTLASLLCCAEIVTQGRTSAKSESDLDSEADNDEIVI
jgi:hypothetical protein